MKRTIFCLIIALLGATFSASVQAKKVRNLRLTSYNIQHGEGLDKKIDHARQAKILRKDRTQVAAIQEVDSVTRRNGGLYSLEEIGRKAKMFSTFAPAINFQGGKYGIGILSKKQPMSVRRIALPGREEPRMLLVAEFKHYVVACTHLSLTDEDRMLSIPIIVEEAKKWSKPFILMGDLNDEPGMPFYKEMQKHFLFLNPSYDKTFPADKPDICIDHVAIFVPTPDATISYYRTWVGEETSSDHRPLHARLGLYQ
ncbi:MAG: endonuclease/exonuclease/phosphatase family protein [Bacteroidaceae bacterium]|nr:endonuclease/exonuclease/phosphatase family protein [Bacteroidaceae bacterium]